MNRRFLSAVLFLATSICLNAQYNPKPYEEKKSHQEVLVGTGFGFGSRILPIIYPGKGDFNWQGHPISPVYTFEFVHAPDPSALIGLAASWEIVRVDHSVPEIVGSSHLDVYDRINLGLRLGYAYRPDKGVCFYFGGRPGVTFWKRNAAESEFVSVAHEGLSPKVTLQMFGGIRVYTMSPLVFGCEMGIGTAPYLMQVHVGYKI